MARKKRNEISKALELFSLKATKATGTSTAFILALSVLLVWAITGPFSTFLIPGASAHTGTTIVPFLMVSDPGTRQRCPSLHI